MTGKGEDHKAMGMNFKLKRLGKKHVGEHDMIRGVRRNVEASVWDRKYSGYVQCRLESKWMNRCIAEKDTKEHGQMLEINFNLQEREILERHQRMES